MAFKYCISCDWLEVCGYGSGFHDKEFYVDGRCFYLQKEERQTSFFKDFYVIKYRNLEYAYIRANPRLQRIRPSFCCVKLANRVLYHEDYVPLLWGLLKALNIRYKGITRLDIAYDCNKFYCGRDPHKFIINYVSKRPDERGGMYLANCKEYTLHGNKSISNDGTMNYIAFGAKNKAARGYIYNKSLELKDVKDKPWIRDMWERNGLRTDGKNQVWRAEISIKCQGKDLLHLETGQLFSLNPNYIATYENLNKVFHFYAAKVFDFRVNQGQKNRRNFSRLNLFDSSIICTCLPKRVSILCDSGRSEKMCANKLQKVSREYVDLSDSIRHSLAAAIEFMNNISSLKQARYRAEQYKQYLDVFAATRFISELDFAYMDACYQRAEAKRLKDRDELYEAYLRIKTMDSIDIY